MSFFQHKKIVKTTFPIISIKIMYGIDSTFLLSKRIDIVFFSLIFSSGYSLIKKPVINITNIEFINSFQSIQMKKLLALGLLLFLSWSAMIVQVSQDTPEDSPADSSDDDDLNHLGAKIKISFKKFPSKVQKLWDTICPKIKVSVDFAFQKTRREKQGLDQVRSYIKDWFKEPIGSDLSSFEKVDSTTQFQDGKTPCKYEVFDHSYPSSQIFNFDQSPNVIFPGGFVQGKDIVTGSQQFKWIPIGGSQRKPLGIYSPGETPINVKNSVAAEVHKSIKKYLSKVELQSKVYTAFVKSDDMNEVFSQLNFHRKIVEQLGIAPIPGDVKKRKNKIFVFLAQGVAQLYPVVESDKGPADVVGAFLNPELGQKDCEDFEGYGWWGPKNIPCYVQKVTYGRFIAASVDQTPRTLQLFKQLKEGNIENSDEVKQKINKIFSDISVKVFSIGSDKQCSLSKIKKNQWSDCFGPLSDNTSGLKPITFELKDFDGNEVRVSNQFKYYKRTCE